MRRNHPWLHKRGNRYYLRARVPADLIDVIGRREIWVSLWTSDYAEARRLINTKAAEVEAKFAAARRRKTEGLVEPIPDEGSFLDSQRLQAIAQEAYLDRLRAFEDGLKDSPDFKPSEIEIALDEELGDFALGLRHNVWSKRASDAVAKILEWHDLSLDRSSPAFAHARRHIARAIAAANRTALRRLRGDYGFVFPDPIARNAHALGTRRPLKAPPPDNGGISLSDLITRYTETPERNIGLRAKAGYVVPFRVLKEVLGEDRDIRTITREDARKVRDVLMKLPKGAASKFPGMTAEQAIEAAKGKGLPTLSPGTINVYLANISAVFNWAVKEDLLDKNPARELSVVDTGAKAKRLPFSIDQLNAIFHAPLYTGCRDDQQGYAIPGPNHPRRGRFWVPLLSLWTGMRLNECCQLDVADIREIDGVQCIVIAPDPEGGDEGDRKRVKTAAGERFVPIHPELEWIGFLEHVEAMRQKGEKKLFPELPIGKRGTYADSFSAWFSRFLKSVKAYTPKTTFHSFRHNYRDALREAGIGRDAVLALGGWAGNGGAEEIYGAGLRASTLYREIQKVQYEGLDLSHLYLTGKP